MRSRDARPKTCGDACIGNLSEEQTQPGDCFRVGHTKPFGFGRNNATFAGTEIRAESKGQTDLIMISLGRPGQAAL